MGRTRNSVKEQNFKVTELYHNFVSLNSHHSIMILLFCKDGFTKIKLKPISILLNFIIF